MKTKVILFLIFAFCTFNMCIVSSNYTTKGACSGIGYLPVHIHFDNRIDTIHLAGDCGRSVDKSEYVSYITNPKNIQVYSYNDFSESILFYHGFTVNCGLSSFLTLQASEDKLEIKTHVEEGEPTTCDDFDVIEFNCPIPMSKILKININGFDTIMDLNKKEYFEPGACWTEYRLNIMSTPPYIVSKTQYCVKNDTIIEGIRYKQIEDIIQGYIGAIREEGEKVYACSGYYGDNSGEFLLYDFSAEKNDVIRSGALEGALSYPGGLTVRNTETIQLENGENRKKISFDETRDWLEGIGSTGGLFSDAMDHATNGIVSYLVCFKVDNNILYVNDEKNSDGKACDNITSDLYTSFAKETNNFIIVSNKIIQIYFQHYNKDQPLSIDIYNHLGVYCKSFSVNNHSKIDINMSLYTPGVYIVSIKYKKEQEYYKIILL